MNPSRSVTFTSSTILVLLIIGVALVAVAAGAPKNPRNSARQQTANNNNNQPLAAAESRESDDGFNAEDQSENSEAEFAEPDGSLDKDASNANDASEANDASDDDSDYAGIGEATGLAGAASAGNERWEGDKTRFGGDSASNLDSSDSNIANAKVRLSPTDMATAAGHHHSHKHYPSGMLKMGAESGKKGAFKWHSKHPVGGKGRR